MNKFLNSLLVFVTGTRREFVRADSPEKKRLAGMFWLIFIIIVAVVLRDNIASILNWMK
jgi:hypothetical protein